MFSNHGAACERNVQHISTTLSANEFHVGLHELSSPRIESHGVIHMAEPAFVHSPVVIWIILRLDGILLCGCDGLWALSIGTMAEQNENVPKNERRKKRTEKKQKIRRAQNTEENNRKA